jgi:hypothetical protein
VDEVPVETTLYSLSDEPPAPFGQRQGERRDGERHLSLFRVGSLTLGDRRELCLIRNVSSGGMMVRAYCPIEPGTRLSVELKEGQNVAGTAAWADGSNVGITFDKPVDVVELLATSMDGPRPRMPRVEVRCFATLRDGARVLRLWTRDISQGGVKVETRHEIASGATVVVTLPGLEPQAGTVRWQDKDCYGVTFNKLIPLRVLVAWLHQQREAMRSAN